jgi:hypothetical protein
MVDADDQDMAKKFLTEASFLQAFPVLVEDAAGAEDAAALPDPNSQEVDGAMHMADVDERGNDAGDADDEEELLF